MGHHRNNNLLKCAPENTPSPREVTRKWLLKIKNKYKTQE
jgi:hypothetical protein